MGMILPACPRALFQHIVHLITDRLLSPVRCVELFLHQHPVWEISRLVSDVVADGRRDTIGRGMEIEASCHLDGRTEGDIGIPATDIFDLRIFERSFPGFLLFFHRLDY